MAPLRTTNLLVQRPINLSLHVPHRSMTAIADGNWRLYPGLTHKSWDILQELGSSPRLWLIFMPFSKILRRLKKDMDTTIAAYTSVHPSYGTVPRIV